MYFLLKTLVLILFLIVGNSARACPDNLKEVWNLSQPDWGPQKPLRYKDYVRYKEQFGLDDGITHSAYHFGKTHRGNPETIAKVKALRDQLRQEADKIDLSTLENIQKSMDTSFDAQIQSEALEMMDWRTAWLSGKESVIETYSSTDRYNINDSERPYPPR